MNVTIDPGFKAADLHQRLRDAGLVIRCIGRREVLTHCRHTLVRHGLGDWQCTEPGCGWTFTDPDTTGNPSGGQA